MAVYKETIKVQSHGKTPTYVDVTKDVRRVIEESGIQNGICVVISPHTTCSVFFEEYSHDRERMQQLFSAIEELSCERRKKAVEKFLSFNADPDVFEQLPLEPSHWGGSGSMIPYMQERIEYLRSLLPFVSGIKYLKQKQRIEQDIDCWKERIHSEEVRELLEYWYR